MTSEGLSRQDGKGRRRGVEWPSIMLCCGVYGGFLAVTWFHDRLPWPIFAALGAVLLALQSSMQHEFIHGHPTSWRRAEPGAGFRAPVALAAVRILSAQPSGHHVDERLTDPFDDPETYYWTAEDWAALGPLGRAFIRVHSTLAGRLLFGPAWNIGRYLQAQAMAILHGDRQIRRIWISHVPGCAIVLIWVVGICGIDPLFYALGIVYPAASILLLRSFAEHRAEAGVFERTAIVENAPIFGFLFLFNNLHAAHHERPALPWYELPAWYGRNRDRLVAANGGLVYDGYGEVARRFLFAPHHVAVHPLRPGTTETAQSSIFNVAIAENTSATAQSMP